MIKYSQCKHEGDVTIKKTLSSYITSSGERFRIRQRVICQLCGFEISNQIIAKNLHRNSQQVIRFLEQNDVSVKYLET